MDSSRPAWDRCFALKLSEVDDWVRSATERASIGDANDGPLTIAEAKSRLARTLGVDPTSIKITVEA